ncbi:MAG: PAS domain S-box protein [Bacteroidales bacterium]|nr:PAS domain S-box protein [Bacteroidales bacterium]
MQEQKTILLVEDNPFNAQITSDTLYRFGYNVITASTGEEAINCALTNDIVSLVLMDIDLGEGIDGKEAAGIILKNRTVPIVFLTSHSEKEYVEKVKAITRYGYVIKNSGDFVLKSTIEMAFELFEAHEKTHAHEELLSNILHSIGDALITTDANCLITKMNRAAESLTGWQFKDAVNKPLSSILKIYNEKTRKEVENPAEKALISGKVERLADHTILRSKDGIEYHIADSAAPLRNKEGKISGVVIVFSDITEKCLMEKKLFEQYSYMCSLKEAALDPLVIINTDGKIIDTNVAAENITGVSRAKLIGSDFTKYFTNPQKAREGFLDTFKYGYVRNYPLAVQHTDGKVTDVVFNASLYHSANGLTEGVFVVARDVTELEIASKEIKALLEEKELILQEVHHRIKNNMNTVAGMMYMQANSLKDNSAIAALNDAQSRVLSMMLLYDKLYISNEFKKMSAREYLSSLVDQIIENFPNNDIVKIVKKIDDFIIDTKKMSDLGIIINEILTNSMKYAFIGRTSGIITVSASVRDNRLTISIADDGNGIPASVKIKSSSSFGLQLVNMMARSLHGQINIESENGTKFTLEFKL